MTIQDEVLLSLMQKIVTSGDGTPSSDAITLALLKIMRKFTPLIGATSVFLIFERSLDAHRTACPWLPALAMPMPPEPAVELLRTSTAAQGDADSLAANRAILTTYIDLITTLIGTRLTVQFLRVAFPADEASSITEEKPE